MSSSMVAGSRWWGKETVALVTGSNKGIGFEIARQLARDGLTVVLTARSSERGMAAKESLGREGLDVDFVPLDVTDSKSLSWVASWLNDRYGGLDILINNAAIYKPSLDLESVTAVLDTNYFGVKRVTQSLLSLLRPSTAGARIINISSQLGKLERLPIEKYRKGLSDIDNLTEQAIDSFISDYLEHVNNGTLHAAGWPEGYSSYSVSKVALNAYTRLLANDLADRSTERKICVNCVHPGYVRTDLNNNKGFLSWEQGADTVVWLSLLPAPAPSGLFFFERKEYSF